jgi:cystathionine gamma-synthase
MTLPNDLNPATIAAQAGGAIDWPSGGVVPPMQPSTTFVRDENYALVNPDNIYSRDNSDIVRVAESVLARLERAEEALLFPSDSARTGARCLWMAA